MVETRLTWFWGIGEDNRDTLTDRITIVGVRRKKATPKEYKLD